MINEFYTKKSLCAMILLGVLVKVLAFKELSDTITLPLAISLVLLWQFCIVSLSSAMHDYLSYHSSVMRYTFIHSIWYVAFVLGAILTFNPLSITLQVVGWLTVAYLLSFIVLSLAGKTQLQQEDLELNWF